MYFIHVKNQIQLANILEASIQCFNKNLLKTINIINHVSLLHNYSRRKNNCQKR